MCYFYFNRYDKFRCQNDNQSGQSDNENSQNDKNGSQEEKVCRF